VGAAQDPARVSSSAMAQRMIASRSRSPVSRSVVTSPDAARAAATARIRASLMPSLLKLVAKNVPSSRAASMASTACQLHHPRGSGRRDPARRRSRVEPSTSVNRNASVRGFPPSPMAHSRRSATAGRVQSRPRAKAKSPVTAKSKDSRVLARSACSSPPLHRRCAIIATSCHSSQHHDGRGRALTSARRRSRLSP